MYDILQVKHMIKHGGMAVDPSLEHRILNDKLTEADHAFLSRSFGALRDIKKNGVAPEKD